MNDKTQSEDSNDFDDHDKVDSAQVKASFDNLVESAEDLLKTTASYSGAEVQAARDKLRVQLDLAGRQLDDYRGTIEERLCNTVKSGERCIRQHPWKAVGMAALAGMIWAKFMSGGDDRRL
ncbi:YqjD family protein [Pusillimonas sp. ANT_WB101]|uniref:DUF883 family protein n=1 Tax=Pusillimonas sp. ANT_WB101 TaxID=2597356 RepID=UPI0011EF92F6|nr:DUF883 family protein [Pusillimonas sp. ANT_WB101]KAA0892978.1 DUF883 domain-containing protein [Pusillimonas sp. ANT_WB101]